MDTLGRQSPHFLIKQIEHRFNQIGVFLSKKTKLMNTQLNPITLPLAQNNVIEASAGTGKTYTMVTLYLRLLLQAGENNFPTALDIEQILVVTFTKDATKELRQRINQRIQAWLKQLQQYQQHQDPDKLDDPELQKLLPYIEANLELAIQRLHFAAQYIDRAAIFTIHGFCQRMLQQYAFDSGLSFNVEVNNSDKKLLQQLNYQLWREQFYSLSEAEAQLISDIFKSPDELLNSISSLLAGNMPRINATLPFSDLSAGIAYYQQQIAFLDQLEAQQLSDFTQWFAEYGENLQKNSVKAVQTYLDTDFSTLNIKARLERLEKLTKLKFYAKKEQEFPLLIHELQRFFNGFSLKAYQESMNYLYVKLLRDHFFAYQDQHNNIDFNDLLRLLRDALLKQQGMKLIQFIRQQYPFAMIDEFQDTDPIQLTIFEKIYLSATPDQQPTGFTVIGDPKQAIYRFRGADIFTYLSVMAQDQANRIENIYTLQHNYRSSKGLITSLNSLFAQAKNPFFLPEIQFPLIEAHQQGSLTIKQTKQKAWQILQLDHETKKKEAYQLAVAELFACHIQQLLKAAEQQQALFIEDTEPQNSRVVEAKDIAILVRDRFESQIIRTALAKKGIASVYLSEKESVFNSPVAQELLLILQACVTPFKQRAVLSALGTTLWGLTAPQIYQLKEDEIAWADLIERLLQYHQIWQNQGILPMLYRLFQTEMLPQRLQQFALGERYLVDLLHLSELLQQAMNQQQNEEALLNWYQQQLTGQTDNDENRLRLEREQNVVKIITIHKSKGLEFPIVGLPFILTKKTNRRNDSAFYHNAEKQLIWDIRNEHSQQIMLENNAEEMRLLYVALTRAKYQLIVGVPQQIAYKEKDEPSGLNALDYLLIQGENNAFTSSMQYSDLFDRALSPEHWQLSRADDLPTEDDWRPSLSYPQTLTVRQFKQNVEKNWLVTSFTGLQAKLQAIYADHFSDMMQDHLDRDMEVDLADNPVIDLTQQINRYYPAGFSPFDFPKGASVGSGLHSYLEKADFSQPVTPESLTPICQYLNLTAEWITPLQTWLTHIFSQSLPQLGALQQINRKDRLTELQFYLKLGNLFNNQQFNQLLHQYHPLYDQHYPIRVDEIRGFIRGFIDVVIRQDNKYYIIDYKSNFLGADLSCYQQEQLKKVISAQRYDLQYLIYTLAVHRYLKLHDPAYQYETHFGGVFYLFLRGMALPDNPQQTGVFFTKPSTALIEKLDQLWGE